MLEEAKAKELVEKFMNDYREDEHSRCRSYDYARKVFLENRKNKDDENALDLVALNLYTYLGSWGMIRGGNLLMRKNYKFLIPAVKTLYRFDSLCDMDFTENDFITKTVEAIKELRNSFQGEEATDVLIGKILMATLSCIPAYDTNVKAGLKAEGVCGSLGVRGVKELCEYCKKHAYLQDILKDVNDQLKKAKNPTGVEYPMMKLVDMILWEYGAQLKSKK